MLIFSNSAAQVNMVNIHALKLLTVGKTNLASTQLFKRHAALVQGSLTGHQALTLLTICNCDRHIVSQLFGQSGFASNMLIWYRAIWMVITQALRLLADAMDAEGQPKPHKIYRRPDGQLVADVFPLGYASLHIPSVCGLLQCPFKLHVTPTNHSAALMGSL